MFTTTAESQINIEIFNFSTSQPSTTYHISEEPEEYLLATNGELIEIDEDQAWFWTVEWQAGENRVEELRQRGEVQTFDSMEEFLQTLPD